MFTSTSNWNKGNRTSANDEKVHTSWDILTSCVLLPFYQMGNSTEGARHWIARISKQINYFPLFITIWLKQFHHCISGRSIITTSDCNAKTPTIETLFKHKHLHHFRYVSNVFLQNKLLQVGKIITRTSIDHFIKKSKQDIEGPLNQFKNSLSTNVSLTIERAFYLFYSYTSIK